MFIVAMTANLPFLLHLVKFIPNFTPAHMLLLIYIYIQERKKHLKINAKIEDVGLTEDLKNMETRNGH